MVGVVNHCLSIFEFIYFITRHNIFKNNGTLIPQKELTCERKHGNRYDEYIVRMVKKKKLWNRQLKCFKKPEPLLSCLLVF